MNYFNSEGLSQSEIDNAIETFQNEINSYDNIEKDSIILSNILAFKDEDFFSSLDKTDFILTAGRSTISSSRMAIENSEMT